MMSIVESLALVKEHLSSGPKGDATVPTRGSLLLVLS
jgi:hypothetical protein